MFNDEQFFRVLPLRLSVSVNSPRVRELTIVACSPQKRLPLPTIILQKRFFFSKKKPHLPGRAAAMLDGAALVLHSGAHTKCRKQ